MVPSLSQIRERAPRLWGVRLLLGLALLGVVLAGIWQGEIHAHVGGAEPHSHAQEDLHHPPEPEPGADGSTADPLHLHDAAVTVVALGPPASGPDMPGLASALLPDLAEFSPPLSSSSPPHRPPIV